jgi:hypothetical protein
MSVGNGGMREEDLPPPRTLYVASEFMNPVEFLRRAGCGGEERELEAWSVNDRVHIEARYQSAEIYSRMTGRVPVCFVSAHD